MATVEEVTTEDLALASELINIEAELREKEYKALERLGSLVVGTDGELDERLLALDGREFAEAASCLLALGWLDRPQA
jgi:hypothetical protein